MTRARLAKQTLFTEAGKLQWRGTGRRRDGGRSAADRVVDDVGSAADLGGAPHEVVLIGAGQRPRLHGVAARGLWVLSVVVAAEIMAKIGTSRG